MTASFFEPVEPIARNIKVVKYFMYDATRGARWFVSLDDLLSSVLTAKGVLWVDVQGESPEERQRIVAAMPFGTHVVIPDTVREELAVPTEHDVVELEPALASYVHGVLSCSAGSGLFTGDQNASMIGPEQFHAETLDAANGMVWCTFAASERVLLTLHDRPLVGLAEVIRSVEMQFPAAAVGSAGAEAAFTTSAVLATLVAFTSETMLPDPTALLGEVDCIDEMVLLIAPGERDQPDLLRRVALLRRRISALRARLYLKEKLLQELVAPAMRGSFVAADAVRTVAVYKDTLEKVGQVADRLDDARDILNQANLNFVTGVSMRMSQSSANMDFKMQLLGQVATICLPLNLIASIFGMNCRVPWQDEYSPNLNAFFAIMALMVVWCTICSIPIIKAFLRGNKAKAIVPSD